MSDEAYVAAGDEATEAVAAAAAAAAAMGHDHPEDTAGAAYHHHQYAGETDPDAVAAAAAAAGGPHGGTDSNRWAKNCDGLAPETLASGKFSKDETETVRRAITEYCDAHNITPGHLCSEQIDHKQECKGAWMEIARALPHRTVQSVYRHGLRQMNPFKRGVWSEQEVQMLLDYVNEHGKKWSGLQKLINRSADSCRDKYREINTDYVKGRWKENETEVLKGLIREHLKVSSDVEMSELAKMVEEQGLTIPWSAISKKMGNRSRLSCFKKWQKMTGQGEPPVKAAGGKRKAEGMPPVLGGDDLTPNPITGDEAEATAAQIAAETVEAVDLPVLDETGDDGEHQSKRGRTAEAVQV